MTTYWLSDFCSLFDSFDINPFSGDDKNQKYNSLTRLIILVTLISAFIFNDEQINILIAGVVSIILSVIIYMFTKNSSVSYKYMPEDKYKLHNNLIGRDGELVEIDNGPTNVVNPTKYADILLKQQYSEAMRESTDLGRKIFKDDLINVRSGMGVNFTERNREDDAAQAHFMKGNSMPDFAETVRKEMKTPKHVYKTPFDRTVQTGTLKYFDSMKGKNLNF